MEVHKHPHHVTHSKKWNEYLLEFFMLFLAVFLGFVAENVREGIVEKERAKQYVESFYEDLKTDSAGVADRINKDEYKLAHLATLSNCYDTISATNGSSSCLLDAIKVSSANFPFRYTQRTLNQLASAGGFRLLKKEDADSIIAYQKDLNELEDFQKTIFQQAQDNVRNTFNLVVSFAANRQMLKVKGMSFSRADDKEVTAPLLLSTDKTLLNKYFNELQLYYSVTHTHRRLLLGIKAEQERLLGYLKNKYGFE